MTDWMDSGLQRLAIAVVKLACLDYLKGRDSYEQFERFCYLSKFVELINIEPEYLIRIIKEEKENAKKTKGRYNYIRFI